MTDGSDQDWREWAYLQRSNWPEAIPEMGPKREHGPYPWGQVDHSNPKDVDDYPFTHLDAASCGDFYFGDVCPYCGVPLRIDQEAVNYNGDRGIVDEISPHSDPVPCYHENCWEERQAEINGQEVSKLGEFA